MREHGRDGSGGRVGGAGGGRDVIAVHSGAGGGAVVIGGGVVVVVAVPGLLPHHLPNARPTPTPVRNRKSSRRHMSIAARRGLQKLEDEHSQRLGQSITVGLLHLPPTALSKMASLIM